MKSCIQSLAMGGPSADKCFDLFLKDFSLCSTELLWQAIGPNARLFRDLQTFVPGIHERVLSFSSSLTS